jgi:hypothetical protein
MSFMLTANVLGLCEEAELEVQMFVLAQMFIRIPNVQFSTETAFSQNPCCAFVLLLYAVFVVRFEVILIIKYVKKVNITAGAKASL